MRKGFERLEFYFKVSFFKGISNLLIWVIFKPKSSSLMNLSFFFYLSFLQITFFSFSMISLFISEVCSITMFFVVIMLFCFRRKTGSMLLVSSYVWQRAFLRQVALFINYSCWVQHFMNYRCFLLDSDGLGQESLVNISQETKWWSQMIGQFLDSLSISFRFSIILYTMKTLDKRAATSIYSQPSCFHWRLLDYRGVKLSNYFYQTLSLNNKIKQLITSKSFCITDRLLELKCLDINMLGRGNAVSSIFDKLVINENAFIIQQMRSVQQKESESSSITYTKFKNAKSQHQGHNLTQPLNSNGLPQIIDNQQSEKQKIIQQNIKLKQQIFELSQQLEDILEKDKARKKRYGAIHPNDDDNTLREKKGQLRKQQLEITEMKNKIYSVKRQLQKIYNNRNLISKEEQLRSLKQELKNLDEEKESLLKIKKEQVKHLKNITSQEQYQNKIQDLKKQLAKVKEEGKTINDKISQAQKILRKNHEQYITKQQKLRELQQKLAAGKQKLKSKKPLPTITPDMLYKLQDQIETLQQERRQNEKLWQQKIRAIDLQFEQKKLEQEKKILILKQKQKEYRLNQLKIKQLRKLVRHNMANQGLKKGSDIDMSQFRHKRNIKYLQK